MKIKTVLLFVLIISLSLSAFAPAFAEVFDNAGLLSSGQQAHLEELIDTIAGEYNFNLLIVTERDAGEFSVEAFADHVSAPVQDGCLLLLLTESRDYNFTARGRGEGILNTAAFNKLEADALKFLKEDDYFEAFRTFINNWETFLTLEAKGRNYNFFYEWNIILVAASWVLAIAVGLGVVMLWKKKMNTALAQTQANAYTIPGSLVFNKKNDRFLYSRVAKTKRQKQSSSVVSAGRSRSRRSGKY